MMRWKSTIAWAFSAVGTSTSSIASFGSTTTSAFSLGRPTATFINRRPGFVTRITSRGRKSSSFAQATTAAAAATVSAIQSLPGSQPSTTNRINNSMNIRLRNATIDDVDLIVSWDEKPHLQDPDVMGDEDYNDWNWKYELTRSNDLSWRHQLIAEAVVTGTEAAEEEDAPNTTTDTIVPIGFVQILNPADDEDQYWGEMITNGTTGDSDSEDDIDPTSWRAIDIWIGEEDYLGQGYGSRIMELVIEEYCFGTTTNTTTPSSVQMVLVDPMAENQKAHRFYQKLGFKPEVHGYRYFGPDKCLVHTLTRPDYFRRKESAGRTG